MYLDHTSRLRFSHSEITSRFGWSMYLDRTFVQRIGSAKVKSKCEVTNCAGYKLRATLLAHSLVVCVFYAVVCILCCGSTLQRRTEGEWFFGWCCYCCIVLSGSPWRSQRWHWWRPVYAHLWHVSNSLHYDTQSILTAQRHKRFLVHCSV